jgi:aminoglycoside N3'-acetyltransferase
MTLYLEKEKLIQDLIQACAPFSSKPVLLHSDLFQIGLTASPKERTQIGQDYEGALDLALPTSPLLIPTFNYDFCKNGLYDRVQSPCQVGALGEYFRQRYPQSRTLTPIFNFVVKRATQDFQLAPSLHVLGKDSLFKTLSDQDGFVLFLGADFSTNTYLHYIEECNNIGYRYIKTFSGKVIDELESTPLTVYYRVRPLIPQAIVYDFPRLLEDAKKMQIVKQCKIGHGELLFYKARELLQFWSEKIQKNEFYLLTPDSEKKVGELRKSKGYPFKLELFEQVAK